MSQVARAGNSENMAEHVESQEQEQPQKTKSGNSLIIWIILAVGSVSAGFAAPMVVSSLNASQSSESAGSEEDSSEPPALIKFGEVTVNLNESKLNRYLRLNISLLVSQTKKSEIEGSLEKNKAILKSWLLGYLADKAMEDIRGATGQNRLRREIQGHFNSVLFPNKAPLIRDVLFEEFNIQ